MCGVPLESESFHNPPPTVLFSTGDGSGGKLDECFLRVKRMTRQFVGRARKIAGPLHRRLKSLQRPAKPLSELRKPLPLRGPAIFRAQPAGWQATGCGVSVPLVIEISCTQIEVHVFRRRGKRLEMLLLRRSPRRSLAGAWQPVTGGIERGESAMAAAEREVLEETGLTPRYWWALEQPASFYDVANDRIRVVPVFAAEVAWADSVYLSDEHDRYAFVSLAEAGRRVLWGTQRQAHRALADEVLSGSSGGAAREITARVAALAGPRVRAATVRGAAGRGNTSGTKSAARPKPSRPPAAGAHPKRAAIARRTAKPKK